MSTKRDRQRAILTENRRLKAAVATIHDLLHRDDVNGAHEACECALDGGTVKQPSLTFSHTYKLQDFAHRFNALCQEVGVPGAAVLALPIPGERELRSIQICGVVEVCRFVELALRGSSSLYMGDHAEGGKQ